MPLCSVTSLMDTVYTMFLYSLKSVSKVSKNDGCFYLAENPLKIWAEKRCIVHTSDSAMLVSLDSDLRLFLPPKLQQHGLSSEPFLAPPGLDVRQSFGVVAQLQQRRQPYAIHALGTRLTIKRMMNDAFFFCWLVWKSELIVFTCYKPGWSQVREMLPPSPKTNPLWCNNQQRKTCMISHWWEKNIHVITIRKKYIQTYTKKYFWRSSFWCYFYILPVCLYVTI